MYAGIYGRIGVTITCNWLLKLINSLTSLSLSSLNCVNSLANILSDFSSPERHNDKIMQMRHSI